MSVMCDKPPCGVCYIPFAADHRRGDRLGRRPSRPLGCHAQMVQVPSSVPPRYEPDAELGQASLVFALAEVPLARRFSLQARPLEEDGYLTPLPPHHHVRQVPVFQRQEFAQVSRADPMAMREQLRWCSAMLSSSVMATSKRS